VSPDSQESVLTDHELLAVTVGDGERGRGGIDVDGDWRCSREFTDR
jgi:hypothetical protein